MKMMVTGSSGFVGSRLCVLLDKTNHEVIKISRTIDNSSKHEFICDLENSILDQNMLTGIDTVFHLAGYAHDLSITDKVKDKYVNLNIKATKNLALQASEMGVKTFVFISSVKAGGGNNHNIYGETKRAAELELLKIAKTTAMKVCIVRPALVYGPNVKGNLLSMHNAIQTGWFPPLPNIPNRRSMIHVDDLAYAILLVGQVGVNKETYIVTDGKSYSTTEIYETFLKVLQKPLPLLRLPLSVLKLSRLIPGDFNNKISKLLSNEIYSSSKIEALGFSAQLEFGNINETLF